MLAGLGTLALASVTILIALSLVLRCYGAGFFDRHSPGSPDEG
jgi:hypothetical protein